MKAMKIMESIMDIMKHMRIMKVSAANHRKCDRFLYIIAFM